jgi:hypothetical protein
MYFGASGLTVMKGTYLIERFSPALGSTGPAGAVESYPFLEATATSGCPPLDPTLGPGQVLTLSRTVLDAGAEQALCFGVDGVP